MGSNVTLSTVAPMYVHVYLVVHEGLEATDTLMHYPTKDGVFPGKADLTARPHSVQENV